MNKEKHEHFYEIEREFEEMDYANDKIREYAVVICRTCGHVLIEEIEQDN